MKIGPGIAKRAYVVWAIVVIVLFATKYELVSYWLAREPLFPFLVLGTWLLFPVVLYWFLRLVIWTGRWVLTGEKEKRS